MPKPSIKQFKLDAYGHLQWAVGWSDYAYDDVPKDGSRGDWLACADLDRRGNYVAYHVVVDSDSGGFNDEMDKGVLTLAEARNKLPGLLEYWLDIASEHLVADGAWFTKSEERDNLRTCKAWRKAVQQILRA